MNLVRGLFDCFTDRTYCLNSRFWCTHALPNMYQSSLISSCMKHKCGAVTTLTTHTLRHHPANELPEANPQ